MTWPWRRKPEPAVVFVVIEKGLPVQVCSDEAAVRHGLEGRDRRMTQVHSVPFRKATD